MSVPGLAHDRRMGDTTLFGAPRPDVVCLGRIELKIPASKGKGAIGRPWKVWQGSSDAEESTVHVLICENAVLAKLLTERKVIGADGAALLHGKLTWFDANQVISKHDIEVYYFGIEPDAARGNESEYLRHLFDSYSNAMVELKRTTDAHISKLSDGYAQMAKAFADGMGKLSEQNKEHGKMARRLERDRRRLTEALLSVQRQSVQPQKAESLSLETALRAISALKSLKDTDQGAPANRTQAPSEAGTETTPNDGGNITTKN